MVAAFYINAYIFGFGIRLIEHCIFSIFIITVGFIDFHFKIIPDKIVCIFAAVNFIFAVLNNIDYPRGIFDNLIGAVSASAILFAVSLFSNGSIGGGDIKFTAAAGFFLGWKLSIAALAAALFFAGVILTPLLIIKKVAKEDVVALGPFLAVGMYAAALLL
jgi:leader peptidase (prepilin peptidase)/N-methyltransferase